MIGLRVVRPSCSRGLLVERLPAVLERPVPLERSCLPGWIGSSLRCGHEVHGTAQPVSSAYTLDGPGLSRWQITDEKALLELDDRKPMGAQAERGVRQERVDVAPSSRIDWRIALPWDESSEPGRVEVAPPQDIECSYRECIQQHLCPLTSGGGPPRLDEVWLQVTWCRTAVLPP